MKIAILNIYSGLVSRGAETAVHEVAKRLQKSHQITIFQGGRRKYSDTNYQVASIPGVHVLPTDPGSGWINKIKHRLYIDEYNLMVKRFTYSCAERMAKENFSVILAINGYQQLRVLKEQKSKLKSKIVFVNHAQFCASVLRMAGWDNWMKLRLAPDVFVTLTQTMDDWCRKRAPKETRVVKIPDGVDLKGFNPRIKPQKLDLPKPLILSVAGLQAYKRVDLLIRAVAKMPVKRQARKLKTLGLPKSGTQVPSLLILGDGPLKSKLLDLGNRLLGSERFKIMTVAYDQMPHYYAACQVFSLPSSPVEAFGISYLEAMATNKPLVAPDDDQRRELTGKGGVLVDVKDTEAYAQALTQALTTNWHNQPRKQAEKYSWEQVADQYEELFKSLAG